MWRRSQRIGTRPVRRITTPTPTPTATPSAETAPTVTATLKDGPLDGRSLVVEMVEGRPPKTIDAPAEDGSCRYCLADWVQSGRSAAYTFLYRV